MRRPCPVLLPGLWLASLVLASSAGAAEDDKAISVGPDWSTFRVEQGGDTLTGHGGQILVEYELGLDRTLSFRAAAAPAIYSGPDGVTFGGIATAGLTYTFDVLRWVPYLNINLGAIALGGGGLDTTVRPLIDVGLGLEVLGASRSWSWGVTAHFNAFSTSVITFSVGPRLTYHWNFF